MANDQQTSTNGTTSNQSLGQINQIARWFEVAVPAPSPQNALTHLGVHFEEVSEMVRALEVGDKPHETSKFVGDVLSFFQRQLKSGEIDIPLNKINRSELLGALCDQIVTAVGIAHMFGMNIEGALKEVADSNDSKFGEDGQPVFNEQRNIMKGPNYKSPDIAMFTKKGAQEDAG